MFDADRLITQRLRQIDASGIRRVFDLAATLKNPINLSIGQPDFDVPAPIQDAAVQAIRDGFNRYTQTQGTAALLERVRDGLLAEFPDTLGGAAPTTLRDDAGLLITSGVSGGLMLLLLACAQEGDEVILPDPYFVMYRHLITLAGAKAVYCDTYPDFQMTAARVEPLITERTKLILFNSPSNPTGVVAPPDCCRDMLALARRHGVLLASDEIYNCFWYDRAPGGFPSPTAFLDETMNLVLLRGFSKSYAMTGWRLGYALGPRAIIEQMTKLQQYSFVCAPSMAQIAGVSALDVDMGDHVAAYRAKRDRVVAKLAPSFDLAIPGGAFYAFPQVPAALNQTATAFVERAIARNVLIIPGSVFSRRDSHFRLSFACDDATLDKGLEILVDLARG